MTQRGKGLEVKMTKDEMGRGKASKIPFWG